MSDRQLWFLQKDPRKDEISDIKTSVYFPLALLVAPLARISIE
jgi:hypothetical protein